MRKLLAFLLASALFMGVAPRAHATLPVEVVADVTATVNQIVNYIQYINQTLAQYTQITNQLTQIENQLTQMERFGYPQTYIHLLQLDQFMAASSNLAYGVGRTVSQFQVMTNGAAALQYTGNGLYANLTTWKDSFGNAIQWNTNNFKKFDAVNQMYGAYDQQLQNYNTTLANLNTQLTTAINNLNAAGSQMETAKYQAQISAISAQINSLGHQTQATAQRVLVQQAQNTNDAARYQEAQLEANMQSRVSSIENLVKSVGAWVGGQN